MAENEEMIIATSDIAIAVKKDGSTVIGKNLDPIVFVKLFHALTDYALKCEEKDLLTLAFTDLLCVQTFHNAIEKRVLSLKKDIE